MRYWIGDIESVSTHWDCACETNYIHAYADQSVCGKCGAEQDEMPDSRAEEIIEAQMWRDMENEATIDRQWERYWLSWMMRFNRRISAE